MYLREMGSVELLSREGEIAIAKRIEAGRETMIAGLCESPLTFQAIIIWRDELERRPDPAARHHRPRGDLCRPRRQGRAEWSSAARSEGAQRGAAPARPRATATRRRRRRATSTRTTWRTTSSLSAMEAELKPQVLETFDRIADTYKKLRRLQDQQVEHRLQNKHALARPRSASTRSCKDEIVRRREVAVAQQQPHRGAGRAALRHQQAPDRARRPADAPGRELRRRAARSS